VIRAGVTPSRLGGSPAPRLVGGFLLVVLLGCSASAGGWSVCFLDHANLELSVAHPHADPNGP